VPVNRPPRPLARFGLGSLIQIGASTVVVWELTDTQAGRERIPLREMQTTPADCHQLSGTAMGFSAVER
jgi:hypothetical protein